MIKALSTTASAAIFAVFAAVCISSMLLGGCASVPMTSDSLDVAGKKFIPDPEKASIYVYRGFGPGFAGLFQTTLDGRIVGSLAPNTYQLLSVLPGQHTVAVSSLANVQQQKVVAEAAKSYYFEVTVRMGWVTGSTHLRPVTEEEGRRGVIAAKRAETTSYE